ncbi:MAG: VOC family protein [Rhodospirillaceae bacterium]|jgi:catechol 2,3-dioxygenase-like lactoylglutathione lyase family enzyme|nr:VOC family protein [Rhodospirillaceae bacterium]MBT5941998.1 VOC family protein [Rhodospirillaceae bacterium]MBT7956941.1 VOC family protein [Rhodospirillaceae bacterium]
MSLPSTTKSYVNPSKFPHGTLECIDLAESRKFYEEFLGLKCVRHVEELIMMTRLDDQGCTVVCVEVGDKARDQRVFNHWGIDVQTREEVDEAYENAKKFKEKYGIKRIQPPSELHGDYSFYFLDRDGNWWEIQCIMASTYEEKFALGDVVSM